jgi:hypothetical protein
MNTSRNRSIVFLLAVALLLVASPRLLFTIRTPGPAATQPVPSDLLEDWSAGNAIQSRVEELRKSAKPVRVLEARARLTTQEGKVESCDGGLFTLRQKVGAYEIELLRAQGDVGEFRYALRQHTSWLLEPSTVLSQGTVRLTGKEGAMLDLEIRRLSEDLPLLPEVVDSWAYASALLEGHPSVTEELEEKEEGLSDFSREASPEFWERLQQLRQEEGEPAATALLERALNERTVNRYDRELREEARRAVESGQAELALRIYGYYIPVGGCSRDQMPRLVAQEYADLCLQQKRLGCFLQLQVRLMGDHFERVAYSSIAARMNEPAADLRICFTSTQILAMT